MESGFGIFFDESTWDGSDFFVPEGTAMVCVTARVKEALEKSDLQNFALTSLKDRANSSLPDRYPTK